MKQRFLLVATLIFAVLFLGSCKRSGINDPVDPAESESSEAKAYASEINFAGWDIAVAGGIDDTLRALLAEHCSGYSATGTSGTELFLLGAYSSTYDSQIEAVLDGGGACVLTENLNDEKNIAAFLKACGFTIGDSYAKDITDLDDLEMLGIHADGGVYFAYNHIYTEEETAASVSTETIEGETGETPDEPEESEDKKPEEKLYSTWQYAALLGAYKWYSDILADEKALKDANTNQPANAPLRAPRKAEGQPQSKDVEEIIKGCPYTITLSHTFPKLWLPKHSGRDRDFIENVTLSVIAKYNMRQIYVFQSPEAGRIGGDYYVVKADLEWVNSGAYKGVGTKYHSGGIDLRYCGFIPYSCTMQTTPIVEKGYTIEIPVGGHVLPETVNRKTDHSETRSFNIGFGATGGGGGGRSLDSIGDSRMKGKFWQGDGAVSLNAGWGWNNTKSYPKYDWYIVQETGSPSAGHTVRMDDDWLPQPMYSDPGFEKLRENYGSTITVHESWIWHIPETKTDSTNAPLKIKFNMKAMYTWMDHFKLATTRITERYRFGNPPPLPIPSLERLFPKFEKVIPILPTNRTASGAIKITNNMVDDKDNALTVSNVTFIDADSKNNKILYADSENIYAYGTELTYTLPTKYKYRVYFKAGVKANTAKWYRMHKPYSIGLGQTISISDLYYVADDVAEGEWHPAN